MASVILKRNLSLLVVNPLHLLYERTLLVLITMINHSFYLEKKLLADIIFGSFRSLF